MNGEPRSAVILLVEDDEDDILFLRRAFKRADVKQAIRVARDGQEAIDYLSGKEQFADRGKYPLPCLIILDLKLPRKSGLEVLQWLRRQPELEDMPVVMVTSSGQEQDRNAAHHHGVEAYKVKPVSLDALVLLAHEIRTEAEDHCKDAQPCPGEEASGS